jgi:hypothetical protein
LKRTGKTETVGRIRRRAAGSGFPFAAFVSAWILLFLSFFAAPGIALPEGVRPQPLGAESPSTNSPQAASSQGQQANPQPLGSIYGTVVDPRGNVIASATVQLEQGDRSPARAAATDGEGYFRFDGVAAGAFQLSITAKGFAPLTKTGDLLPGQALDLFDLPVQIAAATTVVEVKYTKYQLAEQQVEIEEKQRVLGVFPNFYVTYDSNAPSLAPRQKFQLALRASIDPVTFLGAGAAAGLEQALDLFNGYGQGAQGFAKRYGAAYADGFIGTVLGGALLPSLLKQDPRYFYKGVGSTRSRVLYALENAVICKGDNGRWQANYSGILGSLAAGGISNFYYPPQNRGAALVFENTSLGIGLSGLQNIFQEFIVRRLTPHAPPVQGGNP